MGNVESAFSTVKSLFGYCVYSRDPAAQDSEILLKVLCHNLTEHIRVAFEMDLNLEESLLVEWTPAGVTA